MLNPLFAAAVRVQEFCSARKWRTCYIGGICVQRWGERRQTKDGGLTLLTNFDFPLIFQELRPLFELKEEPENEEKLRELMKRAGLL